MIASIDTLSRTVTIEISTVNDTVFLNTNFDIGFTKDSKLRYRILVFNASFSSSYQYPITLNCILPGETKKYVINFEKAVNESQFLNGNPIKGFQVKVAIIKDFTKIPYETKLKERTIDIQKYEAYSEWLKINYYFH